MVKTKGSPEPISYDEIIDLMMEAKSGMATLMQSRSRAIARTHLETAILWMLAEQTTQLKEPDKNAAS